MNHPNIILSHPTSSTHAWSPAGQADGRKLYRKDAIRCGRYVVPKAGGSIEMRVDQKRMELWVNNFKAMQARGVAVDLTVDHGRGAEAKRGRVTDLWINGDRLMFEAEPADEDTEHLMSRCPEVSIEVDPVFVDGHGNRYDESLTAISIVRKPVVPGQQAWERIAASLDSRTANWPVLLLTAEPPAEPEHRSSPRMNLSAEQVAAIRTHLSLDSNEVPDAQLPERLLASLQEIEAGRQSLDESRQKVEQLEAHVEELAKAGEPLKLSRDIQGVLEEAIDTRLNTLVEEAKLTPAAAKKLGESLKAGGAIMLSRETNGGRTSRAMEILDHLRENDPVQLSRILGERSGVQLGRVSDSLKDEDNPLLKDAERRAAASRK